MEHARLGLSSAHRWMACPASVRMCEGIPDSASPAAEEGTRAHLALEEALVRWISTGEELVEAESDEMKDTVQLAFDYIVAAYDNFPGGEKKIYTESKVDLNYFTGRDDTWGTMDVIIESSQRLQIIDYKHGMGIYVSEQDNPQLKGGALGAMAPVVKKTKGVYPWTEVVCTIIQPRYPSGDDKVRSVTYTPLELADWAVDVAAAADATDDLTLLPVAGDSQCKFCDAKATCPAAAKKVTDMCSVFQPTSGVLEPIGEPSDTLTVAQLIEIHDNEPFISGYLKAVDKTIRQLLEQRDPEISGQLKLVRSRKVNQWSKAEDEIVEQLNKGRHRIPKKLLLQEKMISAPQALKLKTLKPEQVKRLNEVISKSEGSLSIVPITDPRDNEFPPIAFEPVEAPALPVNPDYDFL